MWCRILLPLLQSYMNAGDFTPWDKFKASLKENAMVYGSLGVLAAAFLIYLFATHSVTSYVGL